MTRASSCELVLIDGVRVLVDIAQYERLRSKPWQSMGGRVVAIMSSDFSEIYDLATEVAGPGAFATRRGDYRVKSLVRVDVEAGGRAIVVPIEG